MLRHENVMLRRQASRVRYQPGDRLWLAGTLPAGSPLTLGRGVRGDPGDAVCLAPATVARKWDYTSRRRPRGGRPR